MNANINILDPEYWGAGPMLEVYVQLRDKSIMSLPDTSAMCFLELLKIRLLNVCGLGETHDKPGANWTQQRVSVGTWELAESTCVGVKLIPNDFDRWRPCLAVPPSHVDAYFGSFPWRTDAPWVTDDVVRLHVCIIEHIRRLHGKFPLQAAIIQDEGWVSRPPNAGCGIYIHVDVARRLAENVSRCEAGGIKRVHRKFACIPLV